MLDSLFGSKFSNKCKHSIKCIRTRLDPVRKKKQAVLRYLRRDVAELLSHGHDLNAFGRMEALIVEINLSSCYDMIEQYCADILNQLSALQKQRECPDEAKEAISTLIFAAARFSDLPELCDLRRAFNERFGGSMESFVNSEFVKKAQDKTFSDEKKLQLMQGIAQEFSVRFDPKDFHRRMSNPAEAKYDLPEKVVPPRNGEAYKKMPKVHSDDIPREKRPNPKPVATAHKQETQQKVVWDEPRELRAKQQVVRDERKELPAELEESWAQPKASWARPRESRADPRAVQAEPKDIHVVPSKPERTNLYHKDYRLPTEDTPKKHHHKEKTMHGQVTDRSYSLNEEKPGLHSAKSLSEKEQGSNGKVFDRSRRRDNGSDYIRSESNTDREADDFIKPSKGKGINMAPPYTKPKATKIDKFKEEECNGSDRHPAERPPIRSVKEERVLNMVPPYVKPGFEQQTKHGDHYGTSHGERPRPISIRSKVPKPPLADAKTEDELFDEANMNRTPSMRRKYGHRHEIRSHDDEDDVHARHRHREMHDDGVNGEMRDGRHHLRKHKSQGSSAKYDEDEEEGDDAIDYGNLLRGTPRSHRRHREKQSSIHEPERDDEERMMDKLLIHYSRKGLVDPEPVKERSRARHPPPPPLTTRPSVDRVHHAPERAASLPADQVHEEVVRFPARATSLQPDLYSPNGGPRVHPNLPDYDELTARLRALRNA